MGELPHPSRRAGRDTERPGGNRRAAEPACRDIGVFMSVRQIGVRVGGAGRSGFSSRIISRDWEISQHRVCADEESNDTNPATRMLLDARPILPQNTAVHFGRHYSRHGTIRYYTFPGSDHGCCNFGFDTVITCRRGRFHPVPASPSASFHTGLPPRSGAAVVVCFRSGVGSRQSTDSRRKTKHGYERRPRAAKSSGSRPL